MKTAVFIAIASALALQPAVPHAADLPPQSRLGALFVEGAPPPPPIELPMNDFVVVDTVIHLSPWVPGYYGRRGDFYYSNYYGTSPLKIWSRLPYACRTSGNC